MSSEITAPFSLEELDTLIHARVNNDVKYLRRWSKAAVKYYEAEKNRLMMLYEGLAQNMEKIVDELRKERDDLLPNLKNIEKLPA